MRCAMVLALTLALGAGGCAWLPQTSEPHPRSTEQCTALDGSRWNSRAGCVTWNRILLQRLEEGRSS